jgi:hypothetical protein
MTAANRIELAIWIALSVGVLIFIGWQEWLWRRWKRDKADLLAEGERQRRAWQEFLAELDQRIP